MYVTIIMIIKQHVGNVSVIVDEKSSGLNNTNTDLSNVVLFVSNVVRTKLFRHADNNENSWWIM